MIRVVAFLIAVTLVALGVVWVADRPGTVTVTWLGQRADMSVMVAIVGIGLVAIATVFLWSLVRIRPINEAPGDDPATVIGRADVKATHGDLVGAVAEVAALPAAVRAPAQNWIARVQAREAALAAARKLADDAVGALAKAGQ